MFKRYFLFPLRGSLIFVLGIAWMLIMSSIALLGALIVWLLPLRRWRHRGTEILLKLPVYWMKGNGCIWSISIHDKWEIHGNPTLDPQGWYILLSNHLSWVDIPILGVFFANKTPILKFFMKKQLMWFLPLAGFVCKVLGYPLMQRSKPQTIKKNPELKGKDIATAIQACQKVKEFPTTFVIFAEGQRLTPRKHRHQQSPYQHLLKPKAGAMATVMYELYPQLSGIINATIYYDMDKLSMWQLACGNVRRIILAYEVLPVTDDLVGNYNEDRQFRVHFQHWLNNIWSEKDEQLRSWQQHR